MKRVCWAAIGVCGLLLGGGFAAVGGEQSVGFDEEGFFRVEGKRFFPIGAYELPPGWTAKELGEAGFNLVRARADRKAWDEAQAAGLKVWHSFGDGLTIESSNAEAKVKALAQRVATLADHPALLFWESADEPAWTEADPARARLSPEALARGYGELRKLDARHPVLINHAPRNMVETLQRYNGACDFVSVDVYPILPPGMRQMYAITPDGRHGDLPNQTPSCVGEYVRKMRRAAGPGRAVLMVLQGFAWESLRKESERDAKAVRYPSYVESRFMALDAVIAGANGILYWGFPKTLAGHPFFEDLARVTRELRELAPAIEGNTVPNEIERRYQEMGSTIAGGVEALVRERADGRRVLFTANTSVDPARVTLGRLPLRGKAVRSREDGSRIVLENGALTADYPGLGVRVFEEAE
jgi:hypothetical protein